MCGIVGIKRKAKQICPENLGEAVQKLHHRGPDEQSQWISGDKTVGLGHARLSIIDVKGGQQPLASEDGEVIAVVNGEFYDFERIKAELEARGHRFKTNSDSEILVHLYQEKGTACLKELRGEFSFLLWDNKEQRIFAARDRFGIRPLYYAKKLSLIHI